MRKNKILFLALIFLVSLLCVSAVSAADDTVSDVVADTNDVTVLEESIDDANLADSQSDENILKDDPEPPHYEPSFVDLQELVNGEGNEIELQSDIQYKDGENTDGIVINKDLIINGNNYTIDGKNTARIFRVTGNSVVTFKDINFVNAKGSGAGSAIYSERSLNVKAINCNFTGNYANYGAVAGVNVENCIFENNIAETAGGAMVNGSATNCTFINNNGGWYGGAMYGWLNGNNYLAKNCTFINNTAGHGGALSYVNAIDCNFTTNIANFRGGAIIEGTATNCNFTQNKAGERGGAIYNGTAINCSFNQNNATIDGGGLYLGNARDCTFNENHAEYGAGMYEGNATNCNFTKNTVDNVGGAILKVNANDCIFINNSAANNGGAMSESNATNCEFTGNHAGKDGGAIYNGKATNCEFTGNYAENGGGAIRDGYATGCNFTENNAEGGGAIAYGNATNCTFTQNSADIGGAIYNGNAIDSTFTQNSATENGGAIYEGDATGCNFTSNSAKYGGAMSEDGAAINCIFIQNSASEDGGAIKDISATNCTFRKNSASMGGAMSGGKASNCEFILNIANSPDTNDLYGDVSMPEDDCKFIKPEFSASDLNTTYNYFDKFNFNLSTDDEVFDGENVTISIYKNGTFVDNYTALSGEGWTVNLLAGTYQAVLSIPGSNVAPVTKIINVAKDPTNITASDVTTTYNVNKDLEITLKDSQGNPLSDMEITVDINGAKKYTTDSNGQIIVPTKDLAAGNYTAEISFAGNENYTESIKYVNVNIIQDSSAVTVTVKDIEYGENATAIVTLLSDDGNPITGTVNLTIKDQTKEVTVSNGEGSVEFEGLNAGNYTIFANYFSNGNYSESNSFSYFNVEKLASQIVYQNMTTTAVDVDTDGRVGEYFYITLKDAKGNALANKFVQIGFNGNVYNRTTDNDGKTRLQINLKNEGTYTFAVAFLGDENYNGSFIVAKIVVNKQKGSLTVPNKSYSASASTKTLTATFKSASGKLVKGKKVSFTVNGKTYSATTNAKGVATVNVSLNKKGTYNFTAKFAGNNMYAAITKTAKLTIK